MSDNIYMKLHRIKKKTRGKIASTGVNRYNGGKYATLEDIIAVIGPACDEEKCDTLFFPTETGMIMNFIDLEDPSQLIEFKIPWVEIESMGGKTGLIQGTGAYITYSRRYLYYVAFDICEADLIDQAPTKEKSNHNNSTFSNKPNTSKTTTTIKKDEVQEVKMKPDLKMGERMYNDILSKNNFRGNKESPEDVYDFARKTGKYTPLGMYSLKCYMEGAL